MPQRLARVSLFRACAQCRRPPSADPGSAMQPPTSGSRYLFPLLAIDWSRLMKVSTTAIFALLLLAPAPLAAQDWPTKPVKIVVPFAPGSTPDMVGRVIAEELQA